MAACGHQGAITSLRDEIIGNKCLSGTRRTVEVQPVRIVGSLARYVTCDPT